MMLLSKMTGYMKALGQRWTERKKISHLLKLYQQLDQHIAKFQKESGLQCLQGCGKCCENPNIEITYLDIFPLAEELWSTGQTAFWLERIQQINSQGPCVFYKPDPVVAGHGRCSVYPWRPLLCRLFGFSAVQNKHERPALVTCAVIKERLAQKVKETQQRLDQGLDVPLMSLYAQKVYNIDPHFGRELLPINRAVQMALERIGLKKRLFAKGKN